MSNPGIVPLFKRCTKCGLEYPATADFFYLSKDGYLRLPCKRCQIASATQWYHEHHPPKINDVPDGFRHCIECGNVYPSTSLYFSKSPKARSGLAGKCKNCCAIQRGYSGLREWPPIEVSEGCRRCSKCKAVKPLIEFTQDKQKPSGYASRCKSCTNAHARSFNADHPGLASRRSKAWRAQNSQYIKDFNKRYYYEHRDEVVASKRKYREMHPYSWKRYETAETRAVRKMRYLARKLSLPVNFTKSDWKHALNYFNNCCAVCGRPKGLWHTIAADHWIPLSDPRPDNPGTVPWNIVPLCHGQDGCNLSKGNRDPVEWLNWKFGPRKAKRILTRITAYFASLKEDAHGDD